MTRHMHFAIGAFLCAACCWCLAVQARAAEPSRAEAFDRALQAFDAAETPSQFEHAARLFETIQEGGYRNGAVLYNQGNAYMRAGQTARALAAYRQAARLRPRNAYIQENLAAALSAAPGALAPAGPPWWKRVLFWHASLAQFERLWLSALGWTLAVLLALARLWKTGGESARRSLQWALGMSLVLSVLFSASAVLGDFEELPGRHGVVTTEVLARKGNGDRYDPAFTKPLKEGAECRVLERRGDWVRVQFAGIGEGWLPEDDVSVY